MKKVAKKTAALLIPLDNSQCRPDSVDTAGDDASCISTALADKAEVFEALAQSVPVTKHLDRGGGFAFEPDKTAGFEPRELTAEFFESASEGQAYLKWQHLPQRGRRQAQRIAGFDFILGFCFF